MPQELLDKVWSHAGISKVTASRMAQPMHGCSLEILGRLTVACAVQSMRGRLEEGAQCLVEAAGGY